jgi:fibronectin type 3 domain-containing protein
MPNIRIKIRRTPLVVVMPPTAREIVSATPSLTGVVLVWSGGEGTDTLVYRDDTLLATLAVATTTYTDTTGTPGVAYTYKLVSYNSATGKTSAPSTVISTRTLKAAPTGFVARGTTASVALTWDADTVSGWLLTRTDPDGVDVEFDLSAAATSYADTTAKATIRYTYTLSSIDSGGFTSDFATTEGVRLSPDVTAPTAPAGVSVSLVGTGLVVTFTPNGEADWVGNEIAYQELGGSSWTVAVTDRLASPYTVASVDPSKAYSVRLRAYDESDNYSETIIGFAPDVPPAIPAGLAAVASLDGIDLTWNDNAEADFDHYRVYRASAAAGPFALIASPTASDYEDASALDGVASFYRVSAVDDAGKESGYAMISAIRPAPVTSDPGFTFLWQVAGTVPQAPYTLQVDAHAAIAAMYPGVLWHKVDVTWRIEGTGGHFMLNPATGDWVNLATDQVGPKAAWIIPTAGNYTVTRTMSYGGETHAISQSFGVGVSARTSIYVDSVNGSDAANGLTSSTPIKTYAKLATLLGDNKAVYIKRDTAFNVSASINLNSRSNVTLDAYGTGATPVINATTPGVEIFSTDGNTRNVLIQNLAFSGFSTASQQTFVAYPRGTNIIFYNCWFGTLSTFLDCSVGGRGCGAIACKQTTRVLRNCVYGGDTGGVFIGNDFSLGSETENHFRTDLCAKGPPSKLIIAWNTVENRQKGALNLRSLVDSHVYGNAVGDGGLRLGHTVTEGTNQRNYVNGNKVYSEGKNPLGSSLLIALGAVDFTVTNNRLEGAELDIEADNGAFAAKCGTVAFNDIALTNGGWSGIKIGGPATAPIVIRNNVVTTRSGLQIDGVNFVGGIYSRTTDLSGYTFGGNVLAVFDIKAGQPANAICYAGGYKTIAEWNALTGDTDHRATVVKNARYSPTSGNAGVGTAVDGVTKDIHGTTRGSQVAGCCMTASEARADLYVSKSGNDSNSGTSASPFLTISKAALVAGAGQKVLVRDGTYAESVLAKVSGQVGKPIMFLAANNQLAIIDGGMTRMYGIDARSSRYVAFSGFKVINCASDFESATAAVRIGQDATLHNIVSRDHSGTGIGLVQAHRAQLLNVTAINCGLSGVSCAGGDDILWRGGGNTTTNAGHVNNLDRVASDPVHFKEYLGKGHVNPGYGLNKFARTRRLVIEDCAFEDTYGQGLWLDIDNRDYTIRRCLGRLNKSLPGASVGGYGVMLELNPYGYQIVEDCTFESNSSAGLSICECDGAIARNNTFINDECEIRAMNRWVMIDGTNHPSPLQNVLITGNFFDRSALQTSIISAAIGSWTLAFVQSKNIVANNNRYRPRADGTLVRFDSTSHKTLAAVRAATGWETTGSIVA